MPNPQNGVGAILSQGFTGTTVATIYGPIAGQNQQVELRGVVFSNESGTATTVTYGVGRAGTTVGAAGTSAGKIVPIGAAGSTTAIIDATELECFVLGGGDYLWALAGAGSAVACTVSGIVY